MSVLWKNIQVIRAIETERTSFRTSRCPFTESVQQGAKQADQDAVEGIPALGYWELDDIEENTLLFRDDDLRFRRLNSPHIAWDYN